MESHRRSIIKAVSYRCFGTMLTASIALAYTQDLKWAAAIGASDALIKTAFFYVHERVWNRIQFGRPQIPGGDYQI